MSGRWWRRPVGEISGALPAIDEIVSKTRESSRKEGHQLGHKYGVEDAHAQYEQRKTLSDFGSSRNFYSERGHDYVRVIEQKFEFDSDRFRVIWPSAPMAFSLSLRGFDPRKLSAETEDFVLMPMGIDRRFEDGSRATIRWRNIAPARDVEQHAIQVETAAFYARNLLDTVASILMRIPEEHVPGAWEKLGCAKEFGDRLEALSKKMDALLERGEWDPKRMKARADGNSDKPPPPRA